MEYRMNPRSGDKLSVLGFGCMRFPRGITAQIDAGKTEKLILSAIEGGVNYFDTAYIYGGSEAALGGILRKNNAREKVFLATKLPYQRCKSFDDFDQLFKTQLDRLETEYVDYYLIHNLSARAPWDALCEKGIERWIREKKADGRIRQIGFSFHGAQDGFLSLLDAYDWDFCQIQYNYMNESYQAGRIGLQKAHGKGLPVVIMEPLLGGRLANGLPPKAERLFRSADAGLSPAAWALGWLWNQPEVTVVLSGMNSAAQLDDNLKTAERAAVPMPPERIKLFALVAAVFSEAYKIPCTGCNYCMPCPREVNIPGCFAAYNASYAIGFVSGMQQYITGTAANHPEKNYGGRNCVQCGQCARKCPQHIEIPKLLETVTKRMEPWWFQALLRVIAKVTG
jgi:predicted aldo/keto reductase-like oxidoreductase